MILLIKNVAFSVLLLFANVQEDPFMEMKNPGKLKTEILQMTKSTQSIKTDFQQENHLSILTNPVKSEGKLIFKKPSQLKWSYTSPYTYEILFDGDKMQINDEGKVNTFSTSNSELFKEVNELILNVVQGNLLEEEGFTISYWENGSNYMTRLFPKEQKMKEFFSEIDVYYNKKDFSVDKVKLTEGKADFTLITFSNKVFNTTLPDSEFSFD